MSRYIDADKLLEAYDREHKGEPGRARQLIEEAPTVIELPCKVGDEVFTIIECENTFIDKGYIATIALEHPCQTEIYVRYESGLTYWYWLKDIGKRFFFTYEEAEKALKERINGGNGSGG